MRKILVPAKVAIVLAILHWTVGSAEAAFSVKVTVGNSVTVLVDNNTGDADADANSIDTLINLGGYKVNLNASTTSPGADGLGVVNQQSLTIRKLTATSDSITIEVYSDGFNFAPAGLPIKVTNAISATQLVGDTGTPATATATTFYNGLATPDAILSGDSAASASTTRVISSGTNPFTLTNRLVLTNLSQYNATTFGNTDANINLTSTTQVLPVPPAFALVLSALPVGGLFYLRRRKKV